MADTSPTASSTLSPTMTTTQKFSRYRSVRNAPPPPAGPPALPQSEKKDPVDMSRTKSMSRYRRSKLSFQAPPPSSSAPQMPPIPGVPPPLYTKDPPGGRSGARRVTGPIKGQSPHHSPRDSGGSAEIQAPMQTQRKRSGIESEDDRLRRNVREFQEREAARELMAQKALREEQERVYREQKLAAEKAQREKEKKREQEEMVRRQKLEEEEKRMREEEAARVLEENKRRDLERLQKELEAASPSLPMKSPKKERLAFFSRKSGSGSTRGTPPQTASSAGPSPAGSMAKVSKEAPRQHVQGPIPSQAPKRIMEASRPIERVASQAPKAVPSQAPKRVVDVPQQIQQGGGGIVPQTDAPISASNAGERRVLVRCKQSSVNLPVNPETTPKEIIYSAANFMTQNIIPSTAILIESYTQLGLERRVRRYEHVRDVMNSWDRDTQNAFLLENSDTPRFDTDLELSGVPKEQPKDATVYMYHSQKPGTWVKRHITVMSSGQVFIHKKSDAKLGDKNTIAICHLSDFDIYSPTPQQIRKVLKPPKKHCYAVKSQQKTAVFLSTENFVHFFSTDDESISESFYSAVQRWRSWYLVNRMGSGKKAPKPASSNSVKNNFGSALLPSTSDDAEPYMIGTFSSLGLGDFKSGSESEGDFDTEDEERPRQVPFHLRNSVLLSDKEARRVMRESRRHPPIVNYRLPEPEDGEFNSSGLLGRTYTTRQAAAKQNSAAQPTGPFTEGHNLLNRDAGRTMSMKSQSNGNGGGLARSNSRTKPKPLLDFTPQFKEAPQWDKTGKGRGVAPIAGVPLVEVATTPDNPLNDSLPKATVFRRETTTARPGTSARPGTRGGAGVGGEGGLIVGAGNVNGSGVDGKSVMSRGRVRYD